MAEIKVISFKGSKIITEFAAQDLWRLEKRVDAEVKTNEGVLRYTMLPGFLTNMRSGAHAIDSLIPKFTGNNFYNLAILCHDFAYTRNRDNGHYISRLLADQLLKQMAAQSGEIGAFKATLMYRALRLFGGSAYESYNDDGYEGFYKDAALYIDFRWDSK
jgi:hypothetical protein